MFGSNILEVAIGVIFIYLLLSLICTVVNEGIASIINQRGKVLVAGIQNLLNDQNLTGLAQQIYNHGLIVGISKNGDNPEKPNELPSYMSPASFALSLLDILRCHGASIKDKQQKADEAAEAANTHPNDRDLKTRSDIAQAELEKAKKALCDISPQNSETVQDDPGKPKNQSQQGRKRSDLRSAVAISKKIEAAAKVTQAAFAAGRDLASKYDPLESIETAIAALPNSQTKESLAVLLDKTKREVWLISKGIAAGEHYVEGLQHNLEGWFDQAMDRVGGWYKRWAQWVCLVVAAAVVVFANADTIKVARKLINDEALRGAVVSAAETAIQNKTGTQDLINEAQKVDLPLGWTAPLNLDTKDVLSLVVRFAMKIVGLGISVLAVSLGAPFWFDVLSKIINVRAAGKPPQQRQSPAPTK
jgi:hypothetical protein